MKKYWSLLCAGMVIALIGFLYKRWFVPGIITAPDVSFYFPSRLLDFTWVPYSWSSVFGNGVGAPTFNIFYLDIYLHFGVKLLVQTLQIPWMWVSRMMFFWPFLIISSISAYVFVRSFVTRGYWAWIGVCIYVSNVYILMLVSGGQMGLVLSYSVAPLVYVALHKRNMLMFTIATICMILFDLRFSYITFLGIALYIMTVTSPKQFGQLIRFFIIPMLLVIGFHSIWIIPSSISRSFNLPTGYDNPGWLSYLSWAEFSKTLSLLHPNWPENIFGKTYFLRPEFLLLPFAAFASLLWMRKEHARIICWLAIMALGGAFLAKGVQPPFGFIYEWLFTHVPGFSGFRDPTKFYILIVLSYAALIPYTLDQLSQFLVTRYRVRKTFVGPVIFVAFIVYWTILLTPAFTGIVGGALAKIAVPAEHEVFEKIQSRDRQFSRTLAIPWKNRFVYQAENHPIIDARFLFDETSPDAIAQKLQSPTLEERLIRLAVRYVVVPHDFTDEIFITDRVKDDAIRQRLVVALDALPYLVKQKEFTGMTVYEFTRSISKVYERDSSGLSPIPVTSVDPTRYIISLPESKHQSKREIIFSESFGSHWIVWDGKSEVRSQKTSDNLNSFVVDAKATRLELYYDAQRYVDAFSYAPLVTFGVIVVWSVLLWKRRSRVFVVCLGGVVLGIFVLFFTQKNVVGTTYVSWSDGWIKQPSKIFAAVYSTLYGGSEVNFTVLNNTILEVLVIGADPPNGRTVVAYVNGTAAEVQDVHDGDMYRYTFSVPRKINTVQIKTICTGESLCEMSIYSIRASSPSRILSLPSKNNQTITVIGDSISGMYGEYNYSNQLSQLLGTRVRNVSRNGLMVSSSTDNNAGLFILRITSPVRGPVVVALGTNDAINGIHSAIFETKYTELLKTVKDIYPQNTIYTIGLYCCGMVTQTVVQQYNDKMRKVSKEIGTQFIDVSSVLSREDFSDGIHPTKEAHQKIAKFLASHIAKEKAE